MKESEAQKEEHTAAETEQRAKFPLMARTLPVLLLSLGTVSLGMFLPAALWLFRTARDGRQTRLDHLFSVRIAILSLVLPAYFACIFGVGALITLLRKRKTVRSDPATSKMNEKVQWAAQRKPSWKSILLSGTYLMIASEMTYCTVNSQSGSWLYWDLATLAWLCTLCVAVPELRLFWRKQM